MAKVTRIRSAVEQLYWSQKKNPGETGWSHAYGKDIGSDGYELRSTFCVVVDVMRFSVPLCLITHQGRSARPEGNYRTEHIESNESSFMLVDKNLSGGLESLSDLLKVRAALMALVGENVQLNVQFLGAQFIMYPHPDIKQISPIRP